MTDYIEVKPLKTFDNGSGLKTVNSDPFLVEAGEARQLKELGLVSFEDDAKAVEQTEAPVEPVPSPASTKKKDAANAGNEAS